MKRKLLIKGVDMEMLEKQRKILNGIMARIERNSRITISKTEYEALAGIENMLDYWSDEQLAENDKP